MASTLTASTMTVSISESITLNGKNQGGTTIKTIPSIAGHYVAANVRYIRFTNLDDAAFVALTFRNQDNDEVSIKLDYGQSFIWNGDNANGMTAVMNATQDADASSFANFGSLTNIQADAETGTVDLEMVIASV